MNEAALQPSADDLFCDHLCYRVETEEAYQQKKNQLSELATLLHEAIIGGRLVATYKLKQPVAFGDRRIPCIELPAPKPGSPYPAGLEHIELVIKESFESFMARNAHLSFDTKAMAKGINPDIQLSIPPGYSVKFHHMPLEEVVEMEKAMDAAASSKS